MNWRLFILIGLLMLPLTGQAQYLKWNAGPYFGSSLGVSAKVFNPGSTAFHFGMVLPGNKEVKGDFFMGIEEHDASWIDMRYDPLTVYYGVGVRLITGQEKNVRIGARGAGGIQYRVNSFPLLIFAELTPVFYLLPATTFDLDAGIGFQYRF